MNAFTILPLSPFKERCKNMNYLYPRIFCYNSAENCIMVSGEDIGKMQDRWSTTSDQKSQFIISGEVTNTLWKQAYLKLVAVSKQVNLSLFLQLLSFPINKCMEVEWVLQWPLAVQDDRRVFRDGAYHQHINTSIFFFISSKQMILNVICLQCFKFIYESQKVS